MVLSEKLANAYENLACDVFNEMVNRLDKAVSDEALQRRILGFIIPWIKKMQFERIAFPQLETLLVVHSFLLLQLYSIFFFLVSHPKLLTESVYDHVQILRETSCVDFSNMDNFGWRDG